jgi:pterin-4a-carbinolamine dehydratase
MFFHARQRPRRVSKKNESKRGTQQSRVERERREREERRAERAERAEAAQAVRSTQRFDRLRTDASVVEPGHDVVDTTPIEAFEVAQSAETFDAETASERYAQRRAFFITRYGQAGRVLHRAAWIAHNCVAHPLLGVVPGKVTLRLHDRTADVLNLRAEPLHSPTPQLRRRAAWILHNAVVHPLMGVMPSRSAFALHDATVELLDDDNWL